MAISIPEVALFVEPVGTERPTTNSMTLCLNMIVKNEMANLERCLAAVADYIACWVIGDTGSGDGTPAFITAFFEKRGIPGELHRFPFENFAQARNEALDRATASPLGYDYLLFADADMELVLEDPAFRAKLGAPGYRVMQRSSALTYWNTRLVRRDVGARYHGVTHEYLDVPGGTQNLDGVWYKDHASGANRVDKFERDIRLLREALEKEPENHRYWFYLAQSYRDAGQTAQAAEAYAKRAGMGGWDEEAWNARLQLARCLRTLGDNGGFLREALAAFNQRPTRAEPLYDLAKFYRERALNEASMLFSEPALGMRPPEKDVLFIEDFVYKAGIAEEYSIAANYSRDAARKDRGHAACNWLALNRDVPEKSRNLARWNLFFYAEPASVLMPSFRGKPAGFTAPDGFRLAAPSVACWGDRILLVQPTINYTVSRDGNNLSGNGAPPQARNFLCELTPELGIKSATEILLPADWPTVNPLPTHLFENPRPFAWRDALWILFTVRDPAVDGQRQRVLARIDQSADQFRLAEWRVLPGDRPRSHESNWIPLVDDGALRFICECDPTCMIDEQGQQVTQKAVAIAAEQFSGASQAIPFDGGWLAVSRESDLRNGYRNRFIWFDAEFRMQSVSRQFFFEGNGAQAGAGLACHPDGTRVLLSYGSPYGEASIATIEAGRLRSALVGAAQLPWGCPREQDGSTQAAPPQNDRSLASSSVGRRPAIAVTGANQRVPAVFIHGNFRTSSTWFWEKFRNNSSTLSYFEPFCDLLSTLTHEQAKSIDYTEWRARHSPSAPYFREYLPMILRSGGLRLFDKAIPFDWFMPIGGLQGHLRT
ncbi:MAG: glycosyltransferase, partial [Rhizomicrobium sp.]